MPGVLASGAVWAKLVLKSVKLIRTYFSGL
jgi:hypothetical protein